MANRRRQSNNPRSGPSQNKPHDQRIPRKNKFEGSEPELKGNVFRLGYNQADIFAETKKEIGLFTGKTYKNGGDVKRSVDQLEAITIPIPVDLPVETPAVLEVLEVLADPAAAPPIAYVAPVSPAAAIPAPTPTQERIWQREVDGYHRRTTTLERNLEKLFSLVWLQCEPPLRDKLCTLTNY